METYQVWPEITGRSYGVFIWMSARFALRQLSNNVFCIKADGSLEPDTLDWEEGKTVAGSYVSRQDSLPFVQWYKLSVVEHL